MIKYENVPCNNQTDFCPHCGARLTNADQLTYGNIELRGPAEVVFEGKQVKLTPNQHLIVDALVRAKGKAVTRSTLAMIISKDIYDATVSANIMRTRRNFQSICSEFDQLKVLHGFGAYRWDFRPNAFGKIH